MWPQVRTTLTIWLRFAIWSAFVITGLLSFFYMAWVHTSMVLLPPLALIVAGGIAVTLAYSGRLHHWVATTHFLKNPRLTTYIFLGGALLRVAWYLWVPPVFFSDTQDYWSASLR